MGRAIAVGSKAHWDDRRNTSQVRRSAPDALPSALAALRAAREEPWYQWIVKRQRGEHDHAAVRSNGKRAACPVAGCTAELAP
jgi:hypothetical protein